MLLFLGEMLFLILALVLFVPATILSDRKYFGWSFCLTVAAGAALAWNYWPGFVTWFQTKGLVWGIAEAMIWYIFLGVITAAVYLISYTWKVRDNYDARLAKVNRATAEKNLAEMVCTKTGEGETEDLRYGLKKGEALDSELLKAFIKFTAVFGQRAEEGAFRPGRRHAATATTYTDVGLRELLSDYCNDLNLPESFDFKDLKVTNDADGVAILTEKINSIIPPKFKMCKYFVVWAAIEWPATLAWLLFSRIIRQVIDRVVSMFGGTFDRLSAYAFGKIE